MVKVNTLKHYDVKEIDPRLATSDEDALLIFAQFCNTDGGLILHWREHGKERGKGSPCPVCGGKDRFQIVRSKDGRGLVGYCRQCDRRYTPLDLARAVHPDWTLDETCTQIGEALGIQPAEKHTRADGRANTVDRAPASALPSADDSPSLHDVKIIPDETSPKREENDAYTSGEVEFVTVSEDLYRAEGTAPGTPPTLRETRIEARKDGRRVDWIDGNGKRLKKTFRRDRLTAAGRWENGWNGQEPLPLAWDEALKTFAAPRSVLFITEGAKCARALDSALKTFSTPYKVTTLGSCSEAKRWNKYAAEVPQDRRVYVLADNDTNGEKAAETIAKAFNTPDRQGKVVYFRRRPDGTPAPEGYDVADWLEDLPEGANIVDKFDDWTRRNAAELSEVATREERRKQEEEDEAANASALEARRQREEEIENAKTLEALAAAIDPEKERAGLEALPSCLRQYAGELHNKYHYPKEAVIFPALCCVGSFAGKKFTLQDARVWEGELYLKMNVVIVGRSGEGKSPIFNAVTSPIKRIEDEGKEQYHREKQARNKEEAERKEAKRKLKDLEARLKRRKNGLLESTEEELEQMTAELAELEEKATEKPEKELKTPAIYLITPTSPEAVEDTIAQNVENGYLNGSVFVTDEGVSVFGVPQGPNEALKRFAQYSGIADGQTSNRKTITHTNTGDRYIIGKNFAGFLIGVQPGPLSDFLRFRHLREQGFPNRFIKVRIETVDQLDEAGPIPEEVVKQYEAVFQYLRGGNAGAVFELSEGGLDEFKRWEARNIEERKEAQSRGDHEERSFLRKAKATVLTLSVIIRICDFIDRAPGSFYVVATKAGKVSLTAGDFDDFEPEDQGEDADALGLINTQIDAETVRRAVLLFDWGTSLTRVCNGILKLEAERNGDEGAAKIDRLSNLEERALEVVREAGDAGSTSSDIAHRVPPLRNAAKNGKKLRKAVIDSLLEKGQTIKRGARYFIPENPLTDETTEEA